MIKYKIKYAIRGEPKPKIAAIMNIILIPLTSKSNLSESHEQTPNIFFSVMMHMNFGTQSYIFGMFDGRVLIMQNHGT